MMRSFSSCLWGDPTNLPSPVRDCRRAWCSEAVLPAARCVPASARPGGRRAVVAAPAAVRVLRLARRVAFGAVPDAAAATGRALRPEHWACATPLRGDAPSRRGFDRPPRCPRVSASVPTAPRGGGARFGSRLDNARFGARFKRRARRSRGANAARRGRRCRTRRKLVGQRRQSIALRPCRRRRRVGLRLQRRPSRRFIGRRLDLRRRTRRRRRGDHFRLQRPRAVAVVRQRNGARQRFDSGRAGERDVAGSGDRAHDIGFDDHVGRSADDQKVLDIVAAHEAEKPSIIDLRPFEHRKPMLAPARARTAKLAGAEPTQRPAGTRTARKARSRISAGISLGAALLCRTNCHPFADLPVALRRPIGMPMVNSAGNICRRDY